MGEVLRVAEEAVGDENTNQFTPYSQVDVLTFRRPGKVYSLEDTPPEVLAELPPDAVDKAALVGVDTENRFLWWSGGPRPSES